MPSREVILFGLQRISTDLWFVAFAWHLVVGAALVAVLAGWRPSERIAGLLVALLPASVAATAAWSGNPFNALVFLGLTTALLVVASKRPSGPVRLGPLWAAPAGGVLLAIGWVYPHFLATTQPLVYLVAAPLGTVPCPTVFALLGLTLLSGGLYSGAWSAIVAAAAVLYGAFGVFVLGVDLDGMLMVGALLVLAASVSTPRPIQVSRTA
jgi:hypothetical protein